MAQPTAEKCRDCKYINFDGEYGPECELYPPQDITWMHPHPWPLVDPNHKACGQFEKNP